MPLIVLKSLSAKLKWLPPRAWEFLPTLTAIIALVGCASTVGELPTQAPTADLAQLPPPPTPPVTPSHLVPVPTPTMEWSPSVTSPTPTIGLQTSAKYRVMAHPGIPQELVEAARIVAGEYPTLFAWADQQDTTTSPYAALTVNEGNPLARWVYAVAAPFATVADATSMAEVVSAWQGNQSNLGTLILDRTTAAAFSTSWGPPPASTQVVDTADLVGALWANRPSWTLIPFQRLSPELKVLQLDGLSPLDPGFDQDGYPLTLAIGSQGDGRAMNELRRLWAGPSTNRDAAKLTRLAMTGVTALGRATAFQMELQGITTPGNVVGPVMQLADIAHVSHEVPFAPDCPYPNPIGDPIFCARDSYLALIQSIGTDVVELTGNHVNDWGPENFAHTLDLYESAGLQTFGGGRSLAEAIQPALFEHNGNKIAFVGCNPVGPAYAWATEFQPGSRPCDYPAYYAQISQLREQGYTVIATLQYFEFYHYAATPQQQADFRALAEAGAAAVSGSQGHHAQGFDFHQGTFIHYGLGNLFFDQMDMLGTRQSFVDSYIIYEGRLISVELFTGLIENYCCPRQMTEAERAQLLQSLFQASGW